jgi:predicted dehydrogenase
MHTLVFLAPGHFHAALTLRERHRAVDDAVVVYANDGPELREFLALVDAFNHRADRPTAWRPVVRAGDRPLDRLLADRPGDVVVLAGRNDRKAEWMRQLHDAGFHVLADKPWMTSADALPHVRRALGGGALAAEIMTGRHEITSILAERLVREPEVFGEFMVDHEPAIRLVSVHHLEKTVNGVPLRRPPWYFDVRVQGNGLADIPTHLVDQAQRLVGEEHDLELVHADLWPTHVPRAIFSRVTGADDFPDELRSFVNGDALQYFSNADLRFRLRGVGVAITTRWDLSVPSGGGDMHTATINGTAATVRIEQGPDTDFQRRVFVEPHADRARVGAALMEATRAWREYPGLAVATVPRGFELAIPDRLRTGHESHFPLVLDEFLSAIDQRRWPPERSAATLAKYDLLSRALAAVPAV